METIYLHFNRTFDDVFSQTLISKELIAGCQLHLNIVVCRYVASC